MQNFLLDDYIVHSQTLSRFMTHPRSQKDIAGGLTHCTTPLIIKDKTDFWSQPIMSGFLPNNVRDPRS